MAEIVLQEESLCLTLLLDLFSGKFRKDQGFWEQASKFFLLPSDTTEEEILPEDEFPDDSLSLCREEVDRKRIENIHLNENLSSSFIIVNNKGCLFGDHDHKQRL